MKKNRFLECGKIINTHGIRGGVKLECWCDTPEDLTSLKKVYFLEGDAHTEHKVKRASVFKQFVLMELDGVGDIDAAMRLKGTVVYADRDDIRIEEGSYFIADMIGLDVIDADTGRVYGTLTDVTDGVASQIYTVKTEKGDVLFPAVIVCHPLIKNCVLEVLIRL